MICIWKCSCTVNPVFLCSYIQWIYHSPNIYYPVASVMPNACLWLVHMSEILCIKHLCESFISKVSLHKDTQRSHNLLWKMRLVLQSYCFLPQLYISIISGLIIISELHSFNQRSSAVRFHLYWVCVCVCEGEREERCALNQYSHKQN